MHTPSNAITNRPKSVWCVRLADRASQSLDARRDELHARPGESGCHELHARPGVSGCIRDQVSQKWHPPAHHDNDRVNARGDSLQAGVANCTYRDEGNNNKDKHCARDCRRQMTQEETLCGRGGEHESIQQARHCNITQTASKTSQLQQDIATNGRGEQRSYRRRRPSKSNSREKRATSVVRCNHKRAMTKSRVEVR
jgi:hypothetical protein